MMKEINTTFWLGAEGDSSYECKVSWPKNFPAYKSYSENEKEATFFWIGKEGDKREK